MKATWVFLLAVGVVAADVSLGYRYNVPSTPFPLPYQFGESSRSVSSLYNSGVGTGYSSGVGAGYGGAVGTSYNGGVGYQTGGIKSTTDIGTGFYSTASSGILTPTVQTVFEKPVDIGSAFRTQYTSSSQYVAAPSFQQQPTQVFKHFFVHAAPEEPEVVKPRAPIVLPPAQKHVKIIFVKTPTESHRSQITVPVQPQNEEKTIVYVLVKKPEEQHEVIVPKIEQKPPSKPEVYFIKYKNKEDSESVINNIVKDYNQGQQVTVLNSGLGESAFNGLVSTGPVASTAGLGEAAFSTASTFGTPLYDAAVSHDQVSSFGSQGSAFTSANSGAVFNGGLVTSTIAPEVRFSSVSPDVSFSSITPEVTYSSITPEVGFSSITPEVGFSSITPEVGFSTVAPEVGFSTTASSVNFDGASAVATSQGVPHETYGTPKFRIN